MSFYFSSIAPKLNSTLSYLASPAFKSHLFNAFVILVCLIAFYISLVIDIFCFCFALAVNCFYYILDCQPLPSIEEREVDATVYLPLPTPIAGLLMPAPLTPSLIASPVVLPSENRVIITAVPSEEALKVIEVISSTDKCVEFKYRNKQFKATLHTTEDGLKYTKFSYKTTKRYMPIRNEVIAFADDYKSIVNYVWDAFAM